MSTKLKRIALRTVLGLGWLVIIAAMLISPAQPPINRLASDALIAPHSEMRVAAEAGLKSATPCLHGRQLLVFFVINERGKGSVMDRQTEELIQLAKQGANALIPFHGAGLLSWTFEVHVSEFPDDLANASREQVVLSALGKTSGSAYFAALEYANQRKAKGWDGVALAFLPNAKMANENWGLAYINGPYLWFPTQNATFYRGGEIKSPGLASSVFVHELLHHYGALDLYGKFDPEAVSGVDLAPNGPRGRDGKIMQYLYSDLSKMDLAEPTRDQVFGLDDNGNGLPNPLDVAPRLTVNTVSTGEHRVIIWQADGGYYQPKNTSLPTVRLNQVVSVEVWKKAGGRWQKQSTGESALSAQNSEELAIKAINNAGNSTTWCSATCPNPWPGYKIFLPLIIKN